MSFASLLTHALTVTRTPMDDTLATRDEYGQPVPGTPVVTEVMGLVQPRSVEEQADSRSAGAAIADHKIFLPTMDLDQADSITYAGDIFAISGIRKFAYGSVPHLEVDARRVGSVVEGS